MSAFKIAYIEDEKAQREYGIHLMEKWAINQGIDLQSFSFENAEEFLFKCEPADGEKYRFDFLLIDIAMHKMNGLELAKRIRRKDKQVRIAFLTADRDFAIEGYEVGAVRYLLKPVEEKKLFDLLSQVYSELHLDSNLTERFVVLETNGRKERIGISEVLYMEAVGHYTRIYKIHEMFEIKASFTEILKKLGAAADGCFVQSHRSYAVNLQHVQKIMREKVLLTSGIEIPVSRGAYKAINEAFLSMYREEK